MLQSSDRSLLVEGRPSSHSAVTFRSEAIGQEAVLSTSLESLLCRAHLLFSFFSVLSRFSLSCLLLCAPMRVVERFVGLSSNPQAVKQHRESPRYGHRRSFLSVLAPTGGYLLCVASEV